MLSSAIIRYNSAILTPQHLAHLASKPRNPTKIWNSLSSSRKHIVSSFTLKSRTEPEKHQRAVNEPKIGWDWELKRGHSGREVAQILAKGCQRPVWNRAHESRWFPMFPFIPFFGAQWTHWRIMSLSSTEHTQWVGPKLPASWDPNPTEVWLPKPHWGLVARSALLRRHWTICLTPGQWCAECPGIGMLGRSVGKANRRENWEGETFSSVWTGCLSLSLKEPSWFCFTKCRLQKHFLSGTRQGTITPSFHLRPAQDSTPSMLQLRTKSQAIDNIKGFLKAGS